MILEATATGKTVEEAKETALLELGVSPECNVEFEVISLPQKKTLGFFGGSLAKVRVYMEVEDKKYPVVAKRETEQPKKENFKKEKTSNVKQNPKEQFINKVEKSTVNTNSESAALNETQVKEVTDYLEKILNLMGVTDIKTEIIFDNDEIKINFDGNKLGVAIGRKGETLDSLQHLVSLSANRHLENFVRVTLNPGGYRQKREELLVSVAKKSASQALKTRRNVILEPMNSYERRIIHNVIQEIESVTSWSIGENEHRRVCIGTDRENKPVNFATETNRGARPDYNRSDRRQSNAVESKTNREPIKDSTDLPLYGIIK